MTKRRAVQPKTKIAQRRSAAAALAGAAALVAAAVATGPLGGCYRHVTRAEGIGAASSATVYEKNDRAGPLDRLLYGEERRERER